MASRLNWRIWNRSLPRATDDDAKPGQTDQNAKTASFPRGDPLELEDTEEATGRMDEMEQEGNGPLDSRAKVMISDKKFGLIWFRCFSGPL